jgi:hypothetical protein
MTQDEIIEMAEQAGMYQDLNVSWNQSIQNFAKLVADKTRKELREEIIYKWVPPHFVDLAVKEEREACAKVCEDISPKTEPVEYGDIRWGWKYKCPYAAAIRARGEA